MHALRASPVSIPESLNLIPMFPPCPVWVATCARLCPELSSTDMRNVDFLVRVDRLLTQLTQPLCLNLTGPKTEPEGGCWWQQHINCSAASLLWELTKKLEMERGPAGLVSISICQMWRAGLVQLAKMHPSMRYQFGWAAGVEHRRDELQNATTSVAAPSKVPVRPILN